MSMDARLVKRFWIGATVLIMAFTLFVVGRNVVHAIKDSAANQRAEPAEGGFSDQDYRRQPFAPAARYDEYLEQYAREHYRMRRHDDHVYIVEESR